MRIPVAREGVPFIAVCAGLLVVALIWARAGGWGVRSALPVTAGFLALFVVYFFRDPDRRPPLQADAVIAPADGKIIEIGRALGEDFMEGPATRITIFLNIFDVHVQRAPLGGTVAHYAYHPGGYLVAWHEKASTENERASLGIASNAGSILVRQIAGLVARRIVTYPAEGDTVEKGERIGLIRFGSRVDLFIPEDWPMAAQVGDVVRGGQTIVARTAVPVPVAGGGAR